MMGSALSVQGGVSEVEREYLKAGLDHKVNLHLIASHIEGSKLQKLVEFIKAIKTYLLLPKHDNDIDEQTIVHLHLSQGASFFRKLILMSLAKAKQQKVILHLHGSDFEEFMHKNKLYHFLTKLVFDKADHIIVLSTRWERILRDFSDNKNITTLYNPASKINNINIFHATEKIKVLFLGRLGQRKGVYDLLDVIKKNKTYFESRNVSFILAGDGEIGKVTRFVKEHELQSLVVIPGWISGEEKTKYLKNSHILILPSYNEQMPMSILEAMSYGYPILATDIAGIPEMIDQGVNGYLFSPGDLDKLEKYLKILCEDEPLRGAMGLNSIQIIANKFESNLITDQLVKIYDAVLGGRAKQKQLKEVT